MQIPSIGRVVHYTSYGSPGGEYKSECRAAVITGISGQDKNTVHLAVLNPTGMFFNQGSEYHDGSETLGSTECLEPTLHGNPFRYCVCGWMEAANRGGTWHWPEQVGLSR